MFFLETEPKPHPFIKQKKVLVFQKKSDENQQHQCESTPTTTDAPPQGHT
jgi:hypothetical protein